MYSHPPRCMGKKIIMMKSFSRRDRKRHFSPLKKGSPREENTELQGTEIRVQRVKVKRG